MVWNFTVRGRILTKGEVEGKYSEDVSIAILLIGVSEDRVGNHLVYFYGMDWIGFLIVNTLHTTI